MALTNPLSRPNDFPRHRRGNRGVHVQGEAELDFDLPPRVDCYRDGRDYSLQRLGPSGGSKTLSLLQWKEAGLCQRPNWQNNQPVSCRLFRRRSLAGDSGLSLARATGGNFGSVSALYCQLRGVSWPKNTPYPDRSRLRGGALFQVASGLTGFLELWGNRGGATSPAARLPPQSWSSLAFQPAVHFRWGCRAQWGPGSGSREDCWAVLAGSGERLIIVPRWGGTLKVRVRGWVGTWGLLLGPPASVVGNGLLGMHACGEPYRGGRGCGPEADRTPGCGLLRWGRGDQLSLAVPGRPSARLRSAAYQPQRSAWKEPLRPPWILPNLRLTPITRMGKLIPGEEKRVIYGYVASEEKNSSHLSSLDYSCQIFPTFISLDSL
jgi:hypothetical protein